MGEMIEARLFWGTDPLAVAHVEAAWHVRLSDFGLQIEGDDDIVRNGVLVVASLERDGLTAQFSVVRKEAPIGRGRDFGATKEVLLGALLHAAVLSISFYGRGAEAAEEGGRDQLLQMKALLDAANEREAESLGETDDSPPAEPSPGNYGLPGTTTTTRPFALPIPQRTAPATQEVHHSAMIQEAREFGIISMLSPPAAVGPLSPWGAPTPATGSIWGDQIGDAFGVGGVALSGVGEGGGGRGTGIDIGEIGTVGHCTKNCGQGVGYGIGRLGGSHTTHAPFLRCPPADEKGSGCATQVNGRLPPEIIQRIVRQNYGRMRVCYENSLRKNVREGRMVVKFVIGRDGAVSMASVQDNELHDADMAACVGRAFQSMSFPQPEGGIVSVVYPIIFSSGQE
jgi:hypothetical protein